MAVEFAGTADLTALAADLAKAGETIERAAARVVAETAQKVQALAADKAPRRSGRLAGSIGIRYESALVAIIAPSVPYAVFQEYGTGSRGEFGGQAYKIRPRTAAVLSFEVGGRRVFAKEVTHPGIKAHPFMRPALAESLAPMTEQMLEAGTLLITKGPKSGLAL